MNSNPEVCVYCNVIKGAHHNRSATHRNRRKLLQETLGPNFDLILTQSYPCKCPVCQKPNIKKASTFLNHCLNFHEVVQFEPVVIYEWTIYCYLCKTYTNEDVKQQHIKSFPHRELMQRIKELIDQGAYPNTFWELEKADNEIYITCKLCDRSLRNFISANLHLTSNQHRKKYREWLEQSVIKKKHYYEEDYCYCASCNVLLDGTGDSSYHYQTPGHFKKAKEIAKRLAKKQTKETNSQPPTEDLLREINRESQLIQSKLSQWKPERYSQEVLLGLKVVNTFVDVLIKTCEQSTTQVVLTKNSIKNKSTPQLLDMIRQEMKNNPGNRELLKEFETLFLSLVYSPTHRALDCLTLANENVLFY